MNIWTMVKMSPSWHWCTTAIGEAGKTWGNYNFTPFYGRSISAEMKQLCPSYSASLKRSWKLNPVIQTHESVAKLQACLMSWGFIQELSLDKKEEKHCEALASCFMVIFALNVLFLICLLTPPPRPSHLSSCSYRPCGWGSLEIPE